MADDRKHRPPPKRPDLGNREQVRRLRRGMERSATQVVRCQQCGNQQMAEAAFIGPLSTCDKCGTPLHSCRHCRHFESRARFQCRRPIEQAVTNKSAQNECTFFEPRLVLDATGKRHGGHTAKNSKSVFDSLFKD